MKKAIFLLLVLVNTLVINGCLCQNSSFFNKKDFYYRAIYIDKNGDTILKEIIIERFLGKKWFAQRKLQDAVSYIYHTDTANYKKFVSYDDLINENQKKYYLKHQKYKLTKEETIGGYYYKEMFYIHPPRNNQYEILFYAWHPQIILTFLSDSIKESNQYGKNSLPKKYKDFFLDSNRFLPCEKGELIKYYTFMGVPLFGTFRHTNTICNYNDIIINNHKVKAYKVNIESKCYLNKNHKVKIKNTFSNKYINTFNGTVEAIFTVEYGFERILYEFQNGIKIHFYLEKIIQL